MDGSCDWYETGPWSLEAYKSSPEAMSPSEYESKLLPSMHARSCSRLISEGVIMKWEQRSLLICEGSRVSSRCAMVGEEEKVSGGSLKSHWFIIVLSCLVMLPSSV